MKARLFRWLSRAVFFAAALALLATSKPQEWTVAATLSGPLAPSGERGLEITIDASGPPRLRATGVPPSTYSDGGTPCLAVFTAGSKVSCLLPPGATLTSVDVWDVCGGCSSTCAPPPGAFVRATTADVPVWTDTVTSRLGAMLPDHGKDRVATGFQVQVSGAQFIRVTLTATPAGGGPTVKREEQACRMLPGAKTVLTHCTFLIYDTDVKPGTSVEVVAEATGWGTCPSSGCAPPKTLSIDKLEISR